MERLHERKINGCRIYMESDKGYQLSSGLFHFELIAYGLQRLKQRFKALELGGVKMQL